MEKKVLGVFLIFGVLLTLSLVSCESLQFGRETGAEVATPTILPFEVNPEDLYEPTEEIVVCDVALIVTDVESTPNEQEGQDLLVLTVNLENRSTKQVPINSFDFYIVDSSNNVGSLASVQVENPLSNPKLEPGESVSGALPYRVPAGDKGVKLNWQPGWCTGQAIVNIW
jgi:LysM repeat protein